MDPMFERKTNRLACISPRRGYSGEVFSELTKANIRLKVFSFVKIPLIFFCRPRVLALDEDQCIIRIPLRRRTRNHMNSMYFGALAIGADLACGMLALEQVRRKGVKVSFLFKDMQGNFLKRPEGHVHFTCTEGETVRKMLDETIESGERVNQPLRIIATVPSISPEEAVAEFTLTLSLKAASAGKPDRKNPELTGAQK